MAPSLLCLGRRWEAERSLLPSSFKHLEGSDVSGMFSRSLILAGPSKLLNKAFVSLKSVCLSSCYNRFSKLSLCFRSLAGISAPLSQVSNHRRKSGTKPGVRSLPFPSSPSFPKQHPSPLLSSTINLLQQSQKSPFPLTLSFDSKNKAWHRVLGRLFTSAITP